MTDWLQTLTNGPARAVTGRVGVPRVPVLRRYEPGQPVLDGPALVLGDGPLGAAIGTGLPLAGPDGKVAAVVLDATGARTLADLGAVQEALTPAVRRLAPNGRLLVLAPEPGADVEAAAVAEALTGLVRSAGKEVRAGATANLLVCAPDTAPADVASPARFLLSARSAYVCGQVVQVGPGGRVASDTDRPLAGRIAVVTGAARGIGAAIVATLARDGASVVALDMPAAGEALARVANAAGGTALQLDVTADDAPARLRAHVAERHGRVDVVVHNAGITRDKLLANMDADRWRAVLAVNLAAPLRLTAGLRDVLGSDARVVCVSSTSGIAGNRGQSNYAASKAGIIGMVRALGPTLPAGATANAVAPGFIETDMTAAMPFGTREAGRRVNSLRQGGRPADVAETVAWLAEAAAGGVRGQVVRVCGQSILGA